VCSYFGDKQPCLTQLWNNWSPLTFIWKNLSKIYQCNAMNNIHLRKLTSLQLLWLWKLSIHVSRCNSTLRHTTISPNYWNTQFALVTKNPDGNICWNENSCRRYGGGKMTRFSEAFQIFKAPARLLFNEYCSVWWYNNITNICLSQSSQWILFIKTKPGSLHPGPGLFTQPNFL